MTAKKKYHIPQNDADCIEVVRKVGCFVRSCGLAAEYRTGKYLTAKQINELWQEGLDAGIIDWRNNNLKDSAKMMTMALRKLGDSGRYVEVGTITDKRGGTMDLYRWAENDVGKWYPDTFIKKIRQNGPSMYHFCLCEDNGKTIEDPHFPEIKELGIEHIICYRYVRGE